MLDLRTTLAAMQLVCIEPQPAGAAGDTYVQLLSDHNTEHCLL